MKAKEAQGKVRFAWADIMRGICILLVVMGHDSAIREGGRTFIYSFHMPAFFFVSGFF